MLPQRKYINALTLLRVFTVLCFLLAVVQNYLSNGTVKFFTFTFTQFYSHIELRILPLVLVTFFLVPLVKRILGLSGRYYRSELLIASLIALDAYTHVNGFYGYSFSMPFYERIWFDKVMHFLEGIILLLAFYPMFLDFARQKMSVRSHSAWTYWIVTGFISIFFISWEIIELMSDKVLHTGLITSKHDTNEDLAFAYLGFIVAVIILELEKIFSQHYTVVKRQIIAPRQ